MPIREWQRFLVNDFEASLFPHYPVLPRIKQTMYDHGALYASMSGSGSCMFGIFDELPEIYFEPAYTIWTENL
jgi:4-diphosphocytidyl-2-C-methyl-D-erythritol kinase